MIKKENNVTSSYISIYPKKMINGKSIKIMESSELSVQLNRTGVIEIYGNILTDMDYAMNEVLTISKQNSIVYSSMYVGLGNKDDLKYIIKKMKKWFEVFNIKYSRTRINEIYEFILGGMQ
jgi:hypothetical protein